MNKVLMILTSHRLDCFRLTMDCLNKSESFKHFQHVVLLLNGVVGRHKTFVDRLVADSPHIPWDIISGPRGKGPLVANLQNECVRRYPDHLYFKLDEDVFVSPGWVEKMTAAYETFRQDDDLALLTPVIPNNGLGFHHLLHRFPELAEEYCARFPYPITSNCNGPVWLYPQIAEWITRKFLDLDSANAQLLPNGPHPTLYEKFAFRFSINCLVYDYRHWIQMGGIPDDEEPAWGQWVPSHNKFNVLVTNTMLHHYSFFVQQDWLDRSSLLEDMRRCNFGAVNPFIGALARAGRVARQIPGVLARKLRQRNA